VPIANVPQQTWGYFFFGVAGTTFLPLTELNIWNNQNIGLPGFMTADTRWTAQEPGVYRVDAMVGTADIINPNTFLIAYSTAGAPATVIPVGNADAPPSVITISVSVLVVLAVGDQVYVTSGDLGCVLQGFSASRGAPSRLLITKIQ
jgi:hypothetical protein